MNHPSLKTIPALLSQWEGPQSVRTALLDRDQTLSYGEVVSQTKTIAETLKQFGIGPGDRVAIITDKRVEIVVGMFGCFEAGAVLVPVNPHLKIRQIRHILQDSGARLLMGAERRTPILAKAAADISMAAQILGNGQIIPLAGQSGLPDYKPAAPGFASCDLATLFYTSGSTGLPKAVATSQANILAGAESVCTYLENAPEDVILSILPLSFDAGFSQLTTAFRVGARVVLRDYLLPNDISRAASKYGVTGITGVPAIWGAALRAKWDDTARKNIRYFANTGGHLSHEVTRELISLFPNAKPFPMYGLTEAFRSSYLPPDKVFEKQGSIGKAIPGATLMVVDENGAECAPGQLGELVHAGPTVALGYWNNFEEMAKRFRPAPPALRARGITGTVVFSGDLAHRDVDGFLFHEGRRDAQIKISGNRISFTEIEEIALMHAQVRAAAAGGRQRGMGLDPELVLFVETDGGAAVVNDITALLRAELPGFSVPSQVFAVPQITLNNNGKYDVANMIAKYRDTGERRQVDGTN